MGKFGKVVTVLGGQAAAVFVKKQPRNEQIAVLVFAGIFGTALATERGGRSAGALFLQSFAENFANG